MPPDTTTAPITVVVDSGGTDWVTVSIAVLALVVAVIGLVWQVVAHMSSGVRVKPTIRLGFIVGTGCVSWEPAQSPNPSASGIDTSRPVLLIQVVNSGRLPVDVTNVTIGLAGSVSVPAVDHPLSPNLPHRLEIAAEASWYVEAATMAMLVSTAHDTFGGDPSLTATVSLGNGDIATVKSVPGSVALNQIDRVIGQQS